MSLAQLFYSQKSSKAQIEYIELDAVISENHRYTSRITQNPIETGANTSDHIQNEPESLTIEGFITDTPLDGEYDPARSTNAFNDLIDLHEARDLITVVTGLKVYTDMAIQSINVPRDSMTGKALRFSIELVKVIRDPDVLGDAAKLLFNTLKSNIPREILKPAQEINALLGDPAGSIKDQAMTKVDSGRKMLQGVHPEVDTKANSLINLLGGFAK